MPPTSQHHAKSYQGGHGGFIKSRRSQKAGAKKDGGSGPSHVRTVFATVRCDEHGRMETKGIAGKHVRVGVPVTRRERYTLGCPFCALKKQIAA